MNYSTHFNLLAQRDALRFRPQQGLTIMNRHGKEFIKNVRICFRPQQGLTIMNR